MEKQAAPASSQSGFQDYRYSCFTRFVAVSVLIMRSRMSFTLGFILKFHEQKVFNAFVNYSVL